MGNERGLSHYVRQLAEAGARADDALLELLNQDNTLAGYQQLAQPSTSWVCSVRAGHE